MNSGCSTPPSPLNNHHTTENATYTRRPAVSMCGRAVPRQDIREVSLTRQEAYPIQRPEEENIEARPSTGTVPVTMAPVASM